MIDEDRTMQLFGYTSDELSHGSGKPVIAICERCGKYREIHKNEYRVFCNPCAHSGKNHYLFGKHLPVETKLKMSDTKMGTHLSEETKCKMSIARMGEKNHMYGRRGESSPLFGRHHSDETNRKIAASLTGNKNYNWKGGVSNVRHRIFRTRGYKNWRNAVFKRDNYTCQMCNTRGKHLQAHHIHPVRDHYNDLLLFDINNGITLCDQCHRSIYKREYEYIDEFESIIRGI